MRIRGLDDKRAREVYYFGLFPNLLLSLHPDYVMTHRFEPLGAGPDEGRVPVAVPARGQGAPDFSPDYASEFWDITNREDWLACESVYRGLQSEGFRQGPYAWSEDEVHIFRRWWPRATSTGTRRSRRQVHEPDIARA